MTLPALAIHAELARDLAVLEREHRLDEASLRADTWQRDARRRLVALDSGKSLIAGVRLATRTYPYAAVVPPITGVPAEVTLAALSLCTGALCDPYTKDWSRVLQYIEPRSAASPDAEWHTDSTGWPIPSDTTLLTCVRQDPRHGFTELLPIVDAVASLSPTQIGALVRVRAWQADEGVARPPQSRPIIDLQSMTVTFMRCAFSADGPADDPDAVADSLAALPAKFRLRLRPGETLVFNNRRSLHRRGRVSPTSTRMMIRAKTVGLRTPGAGQIVAKPLPVSEP